GAGLICLAGGAMSPVARMLVRGEDPRPLCERLRAIFGTENLFIDLQHHLDPDSERLNRKLLALAGAARIPIVATNDVCFSPSTLTSFERSAISHRAERSERFPEKNGERDLLDVLTCIRLK